MSGTFTFGEYLAKERAGETKHDLVNGQIVERARTTPEHARLAASVGTEIRAQLGGKRCEAFSGDLLIRVLATGMATYPDVSVIRDRIERDPEDRDVLVNPSLLVEIFSDATEASDRGDKFANYRRIPTLMEYVLVSEHEPRIEVFRRIATGWILSEATAGGSVKLHSIEGELSVDAVYANPLEV